MENNNVNNLIEEGKKNLAALEAELGKLVNTAEQVIGIKSEEATQKAEALIRDAKTQIEEKTKEIRESEEFKTMEAEGKKAVADIEVKMTELSSQLDGVAQDLNARLKNFFGPKS